MPAVDLEHKFRTKGLDQDDEPQVRKIITSSINGRQLLSYIYMYGRSFAENEDVLDKCQKFLMNPVPGLTAVCMMVTIDYWNKYGNYYEVMGGFLDIARFDTWYDEIIFTAGFINRNKENIRFPTSLLDKFEKMTSDPRFKELDIL